MVGPGGAKVVAVGFFADPDYGEYDCMDEPPDPGELPDHGLSAKSQRTEKRPPGDRRQIPLQDVMLDIETGGPQEDGSHRISRLPVAATARAPKLLQHTINIQGPLKPLDRP